MEPMSPDPKPERPRLLVVDDEKVLCSTVAAFFADRGFEVECAHSLAEARERLAGAQFRAAILDVGLPDGDGLSLLGSAPADAAVVISATPDEARYRDLGVRRHLTKPVDLWDLERLVAAAAGGGAV